MNTPLDLEAIRDGAFLQHMQDGGADTFDAGFAEGWRTAVAEVERLRKTVARVRTLTEPVLTRTEGQIGTHSDRCYEYHVECLAAAVDSSLNSQEVTQ